MAASATPRTAESQRRFDVAVAFSGGLDSTTLLHATTRSPAGLRVLALHVNHGLQPEADHWQALCEARAQAMGAGFLACRLNGSPRRGESVEAWARAGRHQALHAMAREAGVSLLLLAHHRRDQAETWLLQAMRGAGVAGQSAMPRVQWRDGLCWARPWLDQPRELLERYARQFGLAWIEDPSNADPRFARNRLRQLWPAFPEAEAGLAQSARWAQQALDLARDVAASDLRALAQGEGLDIAGLQALSTARASNALRAWLGEAPASLVERLLRELHPTRTASWPTPLGVLRAYRGRLTQAASGPARDEAPPAVDLNLAMPGDHLQPQWGGRWQVDPVEQGGVALDRLARLTQRGRQARDQFQRAPASIPRSLKKAYQEAGVPAWQRRGPVLVDGTLPVFVPGLGLDARSLASPGQPQATLRWVEDPDLTQGEGVAGGAA